LDLGWGEFGEFGFRRGHHLVWIRAEDAGEQVALVWFSGGQGDFAAFGGFEGVLSYVEAEAALAVALIRAVATKAFVRKNGADIAVELKGGGSGFGLGPGKKGAEGERGKRGEEGREGDADHGAWRMRGGEQGTWEGA
jgi:hypothetical protein